MGSKFTDACKFKTKRLQSGMKHSCSGHVRMSIWKVRQSALNGIRKSSLPLFIISNAMHAYTLFSNVFTEDSYPSHLK